MIDRPTTAPERKRSSWLPILLSLFAVFAVCAAIWLLTMGFFGFVLAAFLATSGVIGMHYLVWGWWLSEIIRREESEESDN